LALCAALGSAAAHATDVNVIGLFGGKAVVVINRGAPRTLSAGDTTSEGVKLISADRNGAVLEIDGKRQTLEMGQHFATSEARATGGTVRLASNTQGHYIADGQVNGSHVRFLVDTGATLVALSVADARRMGIDYRNGEQGYAIVADGRKVKSYRVKLDSVTVGDITLFGVDASVSEGDMGVALLGMSFLSRTEMRRENQELILSKRY
jgi:aspartyl protease family protein